MTPKQASTALAFLKRADLKGAEIEPFLDVVLALRRIVDGDSESLSGPAGGALGSARAAGE